MDIRSFSWLLFAPPVGLWVASLFQPALKAPAPGTFQYSGLSCLLLGWIGALGKVQWVVPWSANVLFWISLVSGLLGRGRHVLLFSLLAIPLALVTFVNRTIYVNEADDSTSVVVGLGFYLWLASLMSLAAVQLIRSRI